MALKNPGDKAQLGCCVDRLKSQHIAEVALCAATVRFQVAHMVRTHARRGIVVVLAGRGM